VESGKGGNVTLWVGVGAALAGILAVVAIAKWRERSLASDRFTSQMRDVQDVLKDCYDKIHEIELHLPGSIPELKVVRKGRRTPSRSLSNGKPVFES
jgi:hypothetical protein